MPRRTVSIIICTRDRAESLRETLRAIGEARVPDDVATEVLVVDNGSRDRTRPVVRQSRCWGQPPRYLFEPRLGVSSARNTGIAAAQGEVLLWTDDDVRPGRNWIEAMCRPILDGTADATAGQIELPEHLERHWLRPWHRVCLAVSEPTGEDFQLIGANMAFARRVLGQVPGFDPELGPGGLGFCDDTLYSLQLRAAGFRIAAAGKDSVVAHYYDEFRLTPGAMRDALQRQGSSHAYVDYHWRHRTGWFPAIRGGKSLLGLSGLRILRRLRGGGNPVIGKQEAHWLWRWSYFRQTVIEAQRPRQYEPLGLKKLVAHYPLEVVIPEWQRRSA